MSRYVGAGNNGGACARPFAGTKTSVQIEASRRRILAAADEARRHIERDLHDGAQQHLVSAALTLRQAQARARGTPAERLVADALEQLREAVREFRNLARGIYPAELRERGLPAALQGVAARSPLIVELRVGCERVPPAVEAAVYFTVAEALTNAAKHAQASRVSVAIEVTGDVLVAEIIDEGIGGASMAAGSGLRGLADRLDAVGGTLSVDSPPGGGTRVRARAPLPATAEALQHARTA